MFKVDLKAYRNNSIYFNYFDVLIKQKSNNREVFLNEIGISPSSYRRAKIYDAKISSRLLSILSSHFSVQMIGNNEIDELEGLLNSIYYDFYYRVQDNNRFYLDELVKYEGTILSPIINLFKILIEITECNDIPTELKKSYERYQSILEFENFICDDLYEIRIILDLILEKDNNKPFLDLNFKSGIIYSSYATVLYLKGEYLSSLFLAQKAKKIYEDESNVVRLFTNNLTIFGCYNGLKNFSNTYHLAKNQLRACLALMHSGSNYNNTHIHYMISLYGIGKYGDVLKEIKMPYQTTEACIYLMSLYNTGKDIFDTYKEYISKGVYQNEYLEHLYKYLVNKNKESFQFLQGSRLQPIIKYFISEIK